MYDVLMYSCGICMPCMYPQILCNVDVMISTLQKRLQDALLSLVGPSSSFRIGSHLGRDIIAAATLARLVTPILAYLAPGTPAPVAAAPVASSVAAVSAVVVVHY